MFAGGGRQLTHSHSLWESCEPAACYCNGACMGRAPSITSLEPTQPSHSTARSPLTATNRATAKTQRVAVSSAAQTRSRQSRLGRGPLVLSTPPAFACVAFVCRQLVSGPSCPALWGFGGGAAKENRKRPERRTPGKQATRTPLPPVSSPCGYNCISSSSE